MSDYWENKRDEAGPPDDQSINERIAARELDRLEGIKELNAVHSDQAQELQKTRREYVKLAVRNAEARIVLRRFVEWADEPSKGPLLDPGFFEHMAKLITQARDVLGEP